MVPHLDPATFMAQQRSHSSSPWMNASDAEIVNGYAAHSTESNMQNSSAIPAHYQWLDVNPVPLAQVQYFPWTFGSSTDLLPRDINPGIGSEPQSFHLAQSPFDPYMCFGNQQAHPEHGLYNVGPHQQMVDPKPTRSLECKWQDCTYRGNFKNEASLLRHFKNMHVSPRAFKCPHCDAVKGRKDSLKAHMRSVHKVDQI